MAARTTITVASEAHKAAKLHAKRARQDLNAFVSPVLLWFGSSPKEVARLCYDGMTEEDPAQQARLLRAAARALVPPTREDIERDIAALKAAEEADAVDRGGDGLDDLRWLAREKQS